MTTGKLPAVTPFYGFLQKPSLVDYPGKISAVFFTSGCNFSCGYCHNARLLGKPRDGITRKAFIDAIDKFRKTDWISGVTLSGGEPTLSPCLPDIISWLKSRGLSVKLDSNGSNPAMLAETLHLIDYIAMDVKCAIDRYEDFVAYGDVDNIRQSIKLIMEQARDYEFRTTIIDSEHTAERMGRLGEAIRGAKRYTLQPFVPQETLPDPVYREKKRTSPDLLKELKLVMEPYVQNVIIKGKQ